MKSKELCVVGLGYIGLPTASLLATKGYKVHGVDVNTDVIATINQGEIHLTEPDLDILVRSAVHSGNLVADTSPTSADIFIIAVPTPFLEGYKPDLSHVRAATEAIAPFLKAGCLVILESTSPVGTTEMIAERLMELRPDLVSDTRQFYVAHCPERVLPGQIIRELVDNDRIVGGVDRASTEEATGFYRTFVNGEVLGTHARTAELAKLVENSSRDVNIAFANELSIICDELNINVWELISLANRHPRVNILRPGPGVGGHCIAVDPWFIVSAAPESSTLIRTARHVNGAKTDWVVEKVRERALRFREPIIACMGLAYKPNVNDLRESPAVHITQALQQEFGGNVLAVEPNIQSHADFQLTTVEEAIRRADVVVGLVAHREFKLFDSELLKEKVVIDTCGAF